MIPLAGAEEAVLEHVPTEVKVTVTTSPRKGLEPTLELAEQLAAHGYAVVPHLAARHVRDRGHLAELVERLRATGASDVLVMAGDAEEPAGEFDGSAAAPAGAGGARAAVPRGRHHRLPGEPRLHLGRGDDQVDVREGGVRDVHRQPDLLRPAR